ncbi:hypothetical protein JXJ21_09610 [candidate division KSB1 bacterium]|nr:hypothetical protein [candidate division KSB1 bacterium]
MIESAIHSHIAAINDCNQRGGRMLSVIDLIDAGTMDVALAAYLTACMRSGASLLVGARSGGAGKTTVMCALLNFLPNHTEIRAVDSPKVLDSGLAAQSGTTCFIAHEVGSGPYYAYVWGEQARKFFKLAGDGHVIASNLHADTMQEVRDQLCEENRVDPEHLAAVTLKIFLRLKPGSGWEPQRFIHEVYESDGKQDQLIWQADRDGKSAGQPVQSSKVVSVEEQQKCAEFLDQMLEKNIRRIEDIRRMLVQTSMNFTS